MIHDLVTCQCFLNRHKSTQCKNGQKRSKRASGLGAASLQDCDRCGARRGRRVAATTGGEIEAPKEGVRLHAGGATAGPEAVGRVLDEEAGDEVPSCSVGGAAGAAVGGEGAWAAHDAAQRRLVEEHARRGVGRGDGEGSSKAWITAVARGRHCRRTEIWTGALEAMIGVRDGGGWEEEAYGGLFAKLAGRKRAVLCKMSAPGSGRLDGDRMA